MFLASWISYSNAYAQISYQSVAGNATRMAHIKNLTMFYTDLENGALPQVFDHPAYHVSNLIVDVHFS
jgi:hypothetical protein